MKKLIFFISIISLSFFVVAFLSCDEIFKKDKCDGTAKPEIEVSIKATIHVLDKDKKLIPNQEVNLSIYKQPCGAESKGIMTFKGKTNEQGTMSSTTVFYNLRNLEDGVWVDVHAVNLGNGSINMDSQVTFYYYNDFVAGTTKEVHIYIYRKF